MKSLAEAVVESVAFLWLSGDDVIDPDAAVKAIQSIGHSLSTASEAQERAVLEYCREQSARLSETTQDQKRREFYETFAEAMGLSDTSQ